MQVAAYKRVMQLGLYFRDTEHNCLNKLGQSLISLELCWLYSYVCWFFVVYVFQFFCGLQGFSLVIVQHKERDFLVAFGGTKKDPSNQVHKIKCVAFSA